MSKSGDWMIQKMNEENEMDRRQMLPKNCSYGSAAPLPPGVDLLSFATDLLTACGTAKPSPRKGYAAPLWDYRLPKSKAAADLLRSFVQRMGELTVRVNDQPVGWVRLGESPPVVASNGIELRLNYSILGQPPSNYIHFSPYPSRLASTLCHGEWAEFGAGRVKLPGRLLPEMHMDGETAVLSWPQPPQLEFGSKGFFGLWRKLSRTTIEAIRIGPESGEIVTTGLVGWTLPRLVWS